MKKDEVVPMLQHLGGMRSPYKYLENFTGNNQFGRHRHRWKGDVNVDIKDTIREGAECT
jgi:hypothetical protein